MKILDVPRSGSYQAITSSHNRAGQYVRNRRSPTQNPTARRTTIRAAMAGASSGFSALTPTEQASWIAAADAHPVTDRLGQSIKLTGHQLYVAVNVSRVNVGLSSSATVPATFAVDDASGSTATFSVASGLSVDMTGSSLVPTTDYVCIGLSRPVPGGRTFWNTFTQVSGAVLAVSGLFSLTTAVYAAQFGTPAVGQKVFARITPVSPDGVKGTAVVLPVVVTA